jgi:hypothetical protein
MKAPISFEQFSKDPLKAIMFLIVLCVGYLYIDIRSTHSKEKEERDGRIEKMEAKIDVLTNHVRRLDSANAYSVSKVEMLTMLR